jgi:hypothetical protein
MRTCPSVEGAPSPLITHRIGADVCLARQATNFHKCHRCIYRGQAAEWQPEEPQLAMVNVVFGSETGAPGKAVEIPRPDESRPARRRAAANG